LRSRSPPQQRQAVGPATITRSRGRCSGNGFACGTLAVKAATVVVLATAISAAISSRWPTLQLLELQLRLIQNPRCAFRARAIELARQTLDPQLLVSNQGLIIKRPWLWPPRVPLPHALPGPLQRTPTLRAATSAAFSASMSSGKASRPESMRG